MSTAPILNTGCAFDSYPPQQAIEAVVLAWAFCDSCLSVFCEFWRSMIMLLSQWVPLFYRGAADVAAFSGYSFELLQKSTSPAVREPQCLTKLKTVNAKYREI